MSIDYLDFVVGFKSIGCTGNKGRSPTVSSSNTEVDFTSIFFLFDAALAGATLTGSVLVGAGLLVLDLLGAVTEVGSGSNGVPSSSFTAFLGFCLVQRFWFW